MNITTTLADNDASWSIAAGDLDDNGFNDLMYGGSGVTFMMANGTGTAFTEVSFPQYVFCQRTNMRTWIAMDISTPSAATMWTPTCTTPTMGRATSPTIRRIGRPAQLWFALDRL